MITEKLAQENERIVKKLDEAVALIDIATENATASVTNKRNPSTVLYRGNIKMSEVLILGIMILGLLLMLRLGKSQTIFRILSAIGFFFNPISFRPFS